VTPPTNTPTTTAKINQSSATVLTIARPVVRRIARRRGREKGVQVIR
jgi:hypothetical protein